MNAQSFNTESERRDSINRSEREEAGIKDLSEKLGLLEDACCVPVTLIVNQMPSNKKESEKIKDTCKQLELQHSQVLHKVCFLPMYDETTDQLIMKFFDNAIESSIEDRVTKLTELDENMSDNQTDNDRPSTMIHS